MELLLEFLFTVSLSFILSFFIAKLLSMSSIIDHHLEAVSRSCLEVKAKSEKYVLECDKGLGFVSEVVKVYAFGESAEEKNTLEESLSVSCGSPETREETSEEFSYGEEKLVNETTEIELAKEEEEEEEEEVTEALECEKENGRDCLKEGLSDENEDDDDWEWEGIERTELEKDFGAAVCFLGCRSNADQILKLGSDVKMQFYGLHKIATQGPCHAPQPMAMKLSARAKWNAWKRLGNMSPEAAMEQYITLLSRSIPGWMQADLYGERKQHSADVQTLPAKQKIAVDHNSQVAIPTGFPMS